MQYSRPAIGSIDAWTSSPVRATGTSHTSGDLRYGTTYTVTVTAVNQDNRTSSPVATTATTLTRTTTAPGTPRNVSAIAHGTKQIRVSWSPPSNSGSSPIRHYLVQYSRPAIGSIDAWTSSPVRATGTSHTSGDLRYGTTYTVTVTAVNQDNRTSSPVATTATTLTRTTAPPPRVTNLYAFNYYNEFLDEDRHLFATWGLPSGISQDGIRYEVSISRPSIGGDQGWEITRETSNQFYSFGQLRSGIAYTVRVVAINRSRQRGETAVFDNAVAIPRPINISIEREGRVFTDDPDALVKWNPVNSAVSYDIDWRYSEIASDRLREIYAQLETEGLSDSRRSALISEAVRLLDSSNGEVSSSRISGFSKPNSNRNNPETRCYVDSLDINCYGPRSEVKGFHPDEPEFRIDSLNENYVLQVRIRAVGSHNSIGPWSEWHYIPNARFAIGCQALEFYENVKQIMAAIDIAGWIITAGSVIAAIFTAGTSVPAGVAGKEALKFIAKEIVKEIVKRVSIKQLIKEIFKDLAVEIAKQSALELIGFTFGCLTYGLDMTADQTKDLGTNLINELKRSAAESGNQELQLNWDNVQKNWNRVVITN